MNELALFAGAGGGVLGGKLLGWRTVCAVEWDAYAASVLVARQNDGTLPPFPIWDDVQTFDGRAWRGRVDVVSGGFPCQDISAAGRGAGINGARSGIWRHMARIIREVGPEFVLVENSPMLTKRGLHVVLGDLAQMGYDAKWGVLGAHHAGAPHKRDRIWIVAHPRHLQRRNGAKPREEEPASIATSCEVGNALRPGLEGTDTKPGVGSNAPEPSQEQATNQTAFVNDLANADCLRELQPQGIECDERRRSCDCGKDVADTTGIRQPRQGAYWYACDPAEASEGEADRAWSERVGNIWGLESRLGRVANGVANRSHRLKAIGNGQVPAVVKLAWETLAPKQ